jgi:hypothetical protein
MDSSTVIAIIGTITALLIAVTSLVAVLKGNTQTRINGEKVDAVHILVNSQFTDFVKRVEQLTATITNSGGTVPVSAPPTVPVISDKGRVTNG